MEVKIKQGTNLIEATTEMVDGVMVVSPKEEKFEPKDGDVVTSGCFYEVNSIFKLQSNEIAYKSHISLYEGKLHKDNSFMMKNIRPATEEEKQKLFDKLKEEGYEWDAEKKELVKLKWKPKYKELYFAPFFYNVDFLFSTCSHIYTEHFSDETRVFKTEAECQEFCDRLNEAISSVKP